MIDMLMADEDKNVLELFQFVRGQLPVRSQFPVLTAPVVKNYQRPLACDGKTAVIVMGDQQILLHEVAHLHGMTNSILRLFAKVCKTKHLSKSRLRGEAANHC